MGISNNLTEISLNFKVYGLIGDYWENFAKGRDYDAFLLEKKM